MAFDDYSTFNLSGTQRSREKKFCEFYYEIIDTFYNNEIESDSVQSLLQRPNELSVTSKKTVQDEYFRCAYLCQLGVHDTCMITKLFYEFIKKYPIIIDKLKERRKLFICCLSSTVVLEVVGICTVIDEALKQFGFLDDVSMDIYVLVISKNDVWDSISKYVLNEFKKTLKKVQVHFQFCTEDLSARISEKAASWLKKADIVTMVKYLSSYTSTEKVTALIQKTQKAMKKKAVFFYVANDMKYHKTLSQNWEYYSNVFNLSEPIHYTLKNETNKVQEDLYSEFKLKFYKYEFFPVISSVWIKERTVKAKRVKKDFSGVEDKTLKLGHKSSNKIRNTDKSFKLVGKFARMDMEKKYKDNSHRLEAKEASTSRYASFDDDY